MAVETFVVLVLEYDVSFQVSPGKSLVIEVLVMLRAVTCLFSSGVLMTTGADLSKT